MKANVQAGRFRDQITIRRYVEKVDAVGGITKEWITVGKTRSFVDGLSGREYFSSAEKQSEDSYYLEFRYFDGLDVKDNILINDESLSLDIESIIDVENRHQYHRVLANKANNDEAIP